MLACRLDRQLEIRELVRHYADVATYKALREFLNRRPVELEDLEALVDWRGCSPRTRERIATILTDWGFGDAYLSEFD